MGETVGTGVGETVGLGVGLVGEAVGVGVGLVGETVGLLVGGMIVAAVGKAIGAPPEAKKIK